MTDHDTTRPRTRGECAEHARPCPWVGCRHHLYRPSTRTASVWRTPRGLVPADEVPEMLATEPATCILDLADGEKSGDEIAEIMGITRTRVNQIIISAITRIQEDRPDLEEFVNDAAIVLPPEPDPSIDR